MKSPLFPLVAVAVALASHAAGADTIVCRRTTNTVKAVTIAEDYFAVTTRFQLGVPNLQPLMSTSIHVNGPGLSCLVAEFSAVVKPTDNYMVFQVTIDGVPMLGHTRAVPKPTTPVVIESEETDQNLPRMVSHQFFVRVAPGNHVVTSPSRAAATSSRRSTRRSRRRS